MNMKRAWVGIAAGVLMMSGSVNAATILFDFNSLADNTNSTGNTGSTGGVVDPIEVYMEGLYGSDITVDWGAKADDDRTEGLTNTYPYLGNRDGALNRFGVDCVSGPCVATTQDRFLINRWNSSVPSTLRDRITITFEIVPITGIEFDWQIFPVTGGKADLTVWVWTEQQIADEDPGTQIFYYQNSTTTEKQNGAMGHFGTSFSSPVMRISFVDWNTAPIGVDNLKITQTPVPGTLVLLGAGFVALGLARRRSKKSTSN
jgi:hypothetical protein